MVSRVDGVITQGVLQGKTNAQVSEQLQKQFGTLKSRANLIARDQTSKFNSDLNRLRQEQAGLKSYEWLTSDDERVRPSHDAHNGKVYSWSKPPVTTGNPGDDVNCRCTARAVVPL